MDSGVNKYGKHRPADLSENVSALTLARPGASPYSYFDAYWPDPNDPDRIEAERCAARSTATTESSDPVPVRAPRPTAAPPPPPPPPPPQGRWQGFLIRREQELEEERRTQLAALTVHDKTAIGLLVQARDALRVADQDQAAVEVDRLGARSFGHSAWHAGVRDWSTDVEDVPSTLDSSSGAISVKAQGSVGQK